MWRSTSCDYRDAYNLIKGTIAMPNTETAGTATNNTNKKVIFKKSAPLTDCISGINSTQVDKAQDIDVVLLLYNLLEYGDIYLKKCWWYYWFPC